MENVLLYRGGVIASGKTTITEDISFSLNRGETLALVGETGSGKTMTALSIMGLLPVGVRQEGGSMLFMGSELSLNRRELLGRRIAYIPQNGHEFLNPARRVRAHLYDSLKKLHVPGSERKERALEALKTAGFPSPREVFSLYPHELSGGMAQRVTIALCALTDAELIIADEPTNGLDERGKEDFLKLLRELFPNAAKLIITHDISLAAQSDRILVLLGGRAMEEGRSNEVLSSPNHPYTEALIGALAKNGLQSSRVLREQRGDCPFYSRCPKAGENCFAPTRTKSAGDRRWRCNG